jgi:sugar-specific transcriptional regulator TrmB
MARGNAKMSDLAALANPPPGTLAALGVGTPEELAYRVLLRGPSLRLNELAAALHVPPSKARAIAEALTAKGLAVMLRQRPLVYRAVPPEIALDLLVRRQSEALSRAGAAAMKLIEEFRPRSFQVAGAGDVIEVLDSQERVLQAIAEVQRSAQRECLCLDKPPYVTGPPNTVDGAEIQGLARGVAYRTLIDVEAFDAPGVLERVRTCMQAGAQLRVASNLSLKLLIADDRAGLIPMSLQALGGPVLLLRASSLLEALREYFDLLWRQAAPLALASEGSVRSDVAGARIPIDVDQLLPRLAAGLNDKAIASQLGVSPRTFDRRIDEFMHGLHARTRFQAGWLAACRYGTAMRTDR